MRVTTGDIQAHADKIQELIDAFHARLTIPNPVNFKGFFDDAANSATPIHCTGGILPNHLHATPMSSQPAIAEAGNDLTPKANRACPDGFQGTAASRALADLARAVSACRRCPRLVACRTAPVPGEGGADARLIVVGLAPSARGADRTGRPFEGIGPAICSGEALAACAVARREVWVTNLVKCAARTATRNVLPTIAEIDQCSRHLRANSRSSPARLFSRSGVARASTSTLSNLIAAQRSQPIPIAYTWCRHRSSSVTLAHSQRTAGEIQRQIPESLQAQSFMSRYQ